MIVVSNSVRLCSIFHETRLYNRWITLICKAIPNYSFLKYQDIIILAIIDCALLLIATSGSEVTYLPIDL